MRTPNLKNPSSNDSSEGQKVLIYQGVERWTIPQGATTSVWAAVVASADEIGGGYCENCHVGSVVPDDVTITGVSEGVRRYALDPENAEALWKKSEELVGESF